MRTEAVFVRTPGHGREVLRGWVGTKVKFDGDGWDGNGVKCAGTGGRCVISVSRKAVAASRDDCPDAVTWS